MVRRLSASIAIKVKVLSADGIMAMHRQSASGAREPDRSSGSKTKKAYRQRRSSRTWQGEVTKLHRVTPPGCPRKTRMQRSRRAVNGRGLYQTSIAQ